MNLLVLQCFWAVAVFQAQVARRLIYESQLDEFDSGYFLVNPPVNMGINVACAATLTTNYLPTVEALTEAELELVNLGSGLARN